MTENDIDEVEQMLDAEKHKAFCAVVNGVFGPVTKLGENGLEPLMVAALQSRRV